MSELSAAEDPLSPPGSPPPPEDDLDTPDDLSPAEDEVDRKSDPELNVTIEDVDDEGDGPAPVVEIHVDDIDSDSPGEEGVDEEEDILDDDGHPKLASLPSEPPSSPPTSVEASIKAAEEDGGAYFPYNTEDAQDDDDYPTSYHAADDPLSEMEGRSYLQPHWTSDNEHSSQWESEVPGPPPDIRISSPSHHHQNAKPISPAVSYQRSPRGSNFSQKSLAPGRRRYRQQTLSRASSASYEPREARKAPLVLLHVSVLLLPGAEEEVLRRLTPTTLERGVLIEHPRGDYRLLEELILEGLDLDDDDMSSDTLKAEEEALGDEHQDEDSWEKSMGVRAVPGRSSWDIRVYAANGLMTPGAWKRVWSDMERVDVEVARKGFRGVKTEALMHLRGSSGGMKTSSSVTMAAARLWAAVMDWGRDVPWMRVLVGLNLLLLLGGVGVAAYSAIPPRQEGMVFAPWPFGGRYTDVRDGEEAVVAGETDTVYAPASADEVGLIEAEVVPEEALDSADGAVLEDAGVLEDDTDDTDDTQDGIETSEDELHLLPVDEAELPQDVPTDIILVESEMLLQSCILPAEREDTPDEPKEVDEESDESVSILPIVLQPAIEPVKEGNEDVDLIQPGLCKVYKNSPLFQPFLPQSPAEDFSPATEAESVEYMPQLEEEDKWWMTWSGVMQKVKSSTGRSKF